MKVDRTIYAVLRHRLYNHITETALLRLQHGRPAALGPAHGEGVAVDAPADIHTTRTRRQRTVFAGIGGELVEGEPDGLRGSRIKAQPGTSHDDTRTNEVGEMRELSAGEVGDLDSIPFIADEQVLIGGKRLDALGEARDEIFGTSGGGLMSDRVHNAEHVLGAMIDLAHQEVLLLLAFLAFGNVLNGAAEAYGPTLRPGPLKIGKSVSLHP